MASRDLRLLGPGKARRSDTSGLLPCRTPIGLSSGQGASLRAQLRLNKSVRNTSSPANLFGQGARVRPLIEDVYASFQTNLWVMTPHSHQHQHSCPGVLPGIPLLQGVPPGHSNLKTGDRTQLPPTCFLPDRKAQVSMRSSHPSWKSFVTLHCQLFHRYGNLRSSPRERESQASEVSLSESKRASGQ